MERGPQIRDINELLLNGFFRTSKAKTPASSIPPTTHSVPSFLHVNGHDAPRERSRSRSRGPRRPPPPRPTVEEEAESLSKEVRSTPAVSYDPPLRGVIDQNPILLEAEVTDAEAARLHATPCLEKDDNRERRFVLVPQSEGSSSREESEHQRRKQTRRKSTSPVKQAAPREFRDTSQQPPLPGRRSRQDLPNLETKVPRDIPPQFRRSASAYAYTPRDKEETSKVPAPRTPSGEYFLSPEAVRGPRDYFTPSQSVPRHHAQDSLSGRNGATLNDKRNSGSFSGSRPGTPSSDKRNSGNFEPERRSRRNSNEKLTRPQQLSEGFGTQRAERHASSHSERQSTRRSSRSSNKSNRRYYSSSEDDIADSDSDHHKNSRREKHGHRLHPNGDYDRHLRSPSRSNVSQPAKPSSRYSSPLPSPKISPSQLPRADQFERSETFPQARRTSANPSSRPVSPHSASQATPKADKLNPLEAASAQRPRSRQSNTAPVLQSRTQPVAPTAPMPIPIPSRIDLHSPGETRRAPIVPQFDEGRPLTSKNTSTPQPWQPPPFQPPSSSLDKPVGSYRRYSEEIESGSIVPLPSCPRTSYVRGRNDWLTLPQCPSFDICPSCYTSTIAPTEFRNMFVPAPFRPAETEVLCDFGSSPWYRIAWLLTRKERRRDLNLFYGLANIAATFPQCLGKHEAVRQWHSITDPKTGQPIRKFNVCPSCVKSVETLLPPIRGIFVKADSQGPTGPRVCDLRFDSKRFVQYFDSLETTSDRAEYDEAPPNTRELASIVRRLALVDECQTGADLTDRRWHIITQLPEFTVCEECFDEVVWPELEDRKAIATMFNKSTQRLPKASCQLYSAKMRGIFKLAVDSDDYKMLAAKARERKAVEMAYKANIAELRRQIKINPMAGKEVKRVEEEWARWE